MKEKNKMMYVKNKKKIVKLIRRFDNVCFFGAGIGSSRAYFYMKRFLPDGVFFCDNNKERQNELFWEREVLSVSDAVKKKGNVLFIICFVDNIEERNYRIRSQLIGLGVKETNILFIDADLFRQRLFVLQYVLFEIKIIRYHLFYPRRKQAIKRIRTITLGEYRPQGGVGGYSAGISCQKCVLGNNYKNIELLYSIKGQNIFDTCIDTRAWYYKHLQYVFDEIKNDEDCVYIAHDYLSAYALSIKKKRYILIYHHQGSVLDERGFFGIVDSSYMKKRIMKAEKEAFKNAMSIHFPSNGAYEAFYQSENTLVDKKTMEKKGLNLPVTVWGDTSAKDDTIDINVSEDEVVVLSIGQFSYAKGLDQVPKILERLLSNNKIKIHWIFVAWGNGEKEVIEQCEALKKRVSSFNYTHLQKCNYLQIQYLHSISDIYLMLHRISVFDISTLEAMKYGKMVILSPVGGNIEYNIDNNIIYLQLKDNESLKLTKDIILEYGRKNKDVYMNYFSEEPYKKRYYEVLEEMI